VFALGIMPYISASIIMQLVSIVSPQMEALKKKAKQAVARSRSTPGISRWCWRRFRRSGLRLPWSRKQGLVLDPGLAFRFVTVVTLLTGTMFVMWLGEQITERGLGNGISIIIFAGIAAGLPGALGGLASSVSQRFDRQPSVRDHHHDPGGGGNVLRGIRRTRPTQDLGELREAPGG
jgi:preprotein translocase subunit SecY